MPSPQGSRREPRFPARALIRTPGLVAQAAYARRRARRAGSTDLELARFGVALGRKLIGRGHLRAGGDLLLAPVSLTRYFEYPFVLRHLPARLEVAIDIASPRLFSLYVAATRADALIEMHNPDSADLNMTKQLLAWLDIGNLSLHPTGVEALADAPATADAVWSISVIEHIAGEYDDHHAMQWMFDAVKPGGRLLLTVPCDRLHKDIYRGVDMYGQSEQASDGGYFFQRLYSEETIHDRLLRAVPVQPTEVAWFGERTPGRYEQYEKAVGQRPYRVEVHDPVEIAEHWRSYRSWSEMPGVGVCGLVFDKPPIRGGPV